MDSLQNFQMSVEQYWTQTRESELEISIGSPADQEAARQREAEAASLSERLAADKTEATTNE